MIIGISTINWIEQLPTSTLNEYFQYLDKLVVSVNSPEDEWDYEGKIFYRCMPYSALKQLMGYWGLCKVYPEKSCGLIISQFRKYQKDSHQRN